MIDEFGITGPAQDSTRHSKPQGQKIEREHFKNHEEVVKLSCTQNYEINKIIFILRKMFTLKVLPSNIKRLLFEFSELQMKTKRYEHMKEASTT